MSLPKDTWHGYIAICSRGLVHSRTMEAVTDFLEANPGWKVRFTHDENIPDAQNFIVRSILIDEKAEWILFVEEDSVPPANLLELFSDAPVQCVDYTLEGGTRSVNRNDDGSVIFCGLGCTLVAAAVFRSLPYPWFTTQTHTIEKENGRQFLKPTSELKEYGGQDVSFCYALQQAQIPIHMVPNIEARHLRVNRLGAPRTNAGCHEVCVL